VPGAAAFVWWYAPAWLPNSSPEVEGSEFTALTYNVLGFRTDPEQIIPVIRDAQADMVALEEILPGWPDPLNRLLADMYPYQVHEFGEGNFSVALLSRFPILETEYRDVGPDGGRHLRAVVEIAEQRVAVYVIHPPAPAWNPRIKHWYDIPRYYDEQRLHAHFEFAYRALKGETLPTLVLCDCNSTPRSRQYKLLDSVLDEAFGAQGWGLGLTHPAEPFPVVRIDYIWYSPEFAALDAKVWPEAGTSDHFPVWARLVLRE
jgi:endonuclease/exonuclease/phosphatase (EEP) superfamily protein YafD